MEWSEEFIEKIIKTFKPCAQAKGEDFTRDDAIESIENMVAFAELLIEIDRNHRRTEMPRLISVLKQIQSMKAH